jgi:hypothetical protein
MKANKKRFQAGGEKSASDTGKTQGLYCGRRARRSPHRDQHRIHAAGKETEFAGQTEQIYGRRKIR